MEIALIISLIALAVALPSCIADSLILIEKICAHRANKAGLNNSKVRHKIIKALHSPKLSIKILSSIIVVFITVATMINVGQQSVIAPSQEEPKLRPLDMNNPEERAAIARMRRMLEQIDIRLGMNKNHRYRPRPKTFVWDSSSQSVRESPCG